MYIYDLIKFDPNWPNFQRLLVENKKIKYSSWETVRIRQKYKFWTNEFQNAKLSEGKQYNLNGPDGSGKYSRDFRHRRQIRQMQNYEGESLLIWAAFVYVGK